MLVATWNTAGDRFIFSAFQDHLGRPMLEPGEAFSVTVRGVALDASRMRIIEPARIEDLSADPSAPRWADRLPGKQVTINLISADGTLRGTWRGLLRDGSHYLRQELTLVAEADDLPVSEIVLIDASAKGARVAGQVEGSPVIAGDTFLGLEHPMSSCRLYGDRARCALARERSIPVGQRFVSSSVIGIAPASQLRRSFLAYLERERVHPYRPFLHYNTWYDIGYLAPYDEKAALKVIEAYGRELVQKRGVAISSFLFDDGWDNPDSLWSFNKGFPNGFATVRRSAARIGAAPGVWLSPWGGYNKPREQRLAFGEARGFEINERGFALSGPVYYKRFRDVCLEMIRAYGVNQFKFDGIGQARGGVPGSAFGSDFEAAIHLIADELRAAEPDLFVNLTTGTWPSPFWLRYANSIWRGGQDKGFAGVGSDRQRWITYRDGQTYQNIVRKGPLYPMNSLMLHGIIYATHASKLNVDPHGDFPSEVRTYFGSGTQLQEMYITPSLLSSSDWDTLAEAARWSRRHASTLVDTHWVGGDPARLDVYGWAAWSPEGATLVLRNPSDTPASFPVDVQVVLELPQGAPQRYRGRSPWKADADRAPVEFIAGQPRAISFRPFEAITLDLTALE